MTVFLVPARAARYALYCEAGATTADEGDASGDGVIARLKAGFRRAVDEGEAAARDGDTGTAGHSRLRRFITRKLAEAVAEQRLLWHLRHETAACLMHPDRLSGDEALAIARTEFGHDYGRHRRWLVIDGLIAAVTGPVFFFVPGPNVLSWYFTFRAIGHFLSMRGANRALTRVAWTTEATPHLTDIADALALPGEERDARVAQAAAALGLERLAAFVTRVADQPA